MFPDRKAPLFQRFSHAEQVAGLAFSSACFLAANAYSLRAQKHPVAEGARARPVRRQIINPTLMALDG